MSKLLYIQCFMSDTVPCDGSSSETSGHQREVVRHRYEDKCLCTLDNLINSIYISGAIFRAEEIRRGLQIGYITQRRLHPKLHKDQKNEKAKTLGRGKNMI